MCCGVAGGDGRDGQAGSPGDRDGHRDGDRGGDSPFAAFGRSKSPVLSPG